MAEELAEGHMRQLGFSDARRTPGGVDGGFDVIASGAVAQVKHHAATIGAPDVQRLRGAAHDGRAALFYSSSGYTRAALDYAENARVALFVYDISSTVRPVNDEAERLQAAATSSTGGQVGATSMGATELDVQNARLEAVRAANERLDEYVEAILAAEPKYSHGEDNDDEWDAHLSGIDRSNAAALITVEWANQYLAASQACEGRVRTAVDLDTFIRVEYAKRRQLLELFGASPDEFPVANPF